MKLVRKLGNGQLFAEILMDVIQTIGNPYQFLFCLQMIACNTRLLCDKKAKLAQYLFCDGVDKKVGVVQSLAFVYHVDILLYLRKLPLRQGEKHILVIVRTQIRLCFKQKEEAFCVFKFRKAIVNKIPVYQHVINIKTALVYISVLYVRRD